MNVTIIGSGTGVPSVKRASPSILIETGSSKILCDTGPGTLRQLLKTGTSLNDIDIIAYSHFHIDHTADMIPFIFACKYSPGNIRSRNIKILGSPGIIRLFNNLADAYGSWVIPEHFSIEWIETGKSTMLFDGFSITTAPVNHIDSSIAMRIEDSAGKSIVYSGDTAYCEEIVKLAHKSDLLILECSFPEHMECTGHLIPSLAGKIATESQTNRLVLTHFYPPCDENDILTPLRKEFAGDVVMAKDLMKISILKKSGIPELSEMEQNNNIH